MSYIAPNGNIWLLHNVPLDKTYQNTLYWPATAAGKLAQVNYFVGTAQNPSAYVKYSFTNQYYSRHEKGSIRVAVLADNIFDCNYLVFQNYSFGAAKYFFAFITSVEYVNNSVTQVNFEIDVIQTWYFDFTFEPCFVERMHTLTDIAGDNIVPETLNLGEYVHAEPLTKISALTDSFYIVVANSDVLLGAVVSGELYGGIYGGATLRAFQSNSAGGVNQYLSDLVSAGKGDAIVAIYMIPAYMLSSNISIPTEGKDLQPGDIVQMPFEVTLSDINTANPLVENFYPHNKKLYTYPYTYLNIETPTGSRLTLRYEFFYNGPKVRVGGCITQPVQIVLMPYQYKQQLSTGYTSALTDAFSEGIVLDSFPVCSWNSDTYAAWVAQNSIPLQTQLMGQAIASIPSIITGGARGALYATASIAHTITSALAESEKASIVGDKLSGNVSGSPMLSMGKFTFWFSRVSVDVATARLIDSYFDRFGYAVKTVTTPQRKNRKYYTYVQTVGCILHGSIPADDEDKICRLHDNGITYWDATQAAADHIDIGNFSVGGANTPTGGA